MRNKALGSLAGLLILLVMYVGAYYALVESVPVFVFSGGGGAVMESPGAPRYRIGGDTSRSVFRHIHEIDKKLRPDYWYFTGEEMTEKYGRP